MAILVLGNDKTKAIPVLGSGGSTPVVSPLNVTPTTSPQQFIPSTGTDGYNPVNVAAVTSSIDANISAGNIKNGVRILGVTGNYSGTTPSGTFYVYSNGYYNIANYANVNVEVDSVPYYNFEYRDFSSSLSYGVDVDGRVLENELSAASKISVCVFGDPLLRNLCIQIEDGNTDVISFEEFLYNYGIMDTAYCYYNCLATGCVQNLDSIVYTIVYGDDKNTNSWISFDLTIDLT